MDRRLFVRCLALLVLIPAATVIIGCSKKAPAEANPTEVKEFFAAVDDGDADIIRRLLQAKPYLANARNSTGDSALEVAKRKGNDDLVEVLKKAGAK